MAAALVAARVLTIRPKNIQVLIVKANLALTTWIFFWSDRQNSSSYERIIYAAAMISHSCLLANYIIRPVLL